MPKPTIIFEGNVTRDPESQYTPSGEMVTKFSVAVNYDFKGEKTDFYNCSVWGEKQGEVIKRLIQKGTQVFIEGKFEIRLW